METPALTGTVFDAHAFRGQAFAHALKLLPVFSDCGFQPMGKWKVAASGTPVVIYNAGARGLSDARHRESVGAIRNANPDVPVVAMCDTYDHDDIEAAVELELRGVIPTDFAQDVVVAVFYIVRAGGQYFPFPTKADGEAAPFRIVADSPAEARQSRSDDAGRLELTPRQTEVLNGLRRGHSNKSIARDLDIAEATVKIYVRQLLRKFDAANRTQIVMNAAASMPARYPDPSRYRDVG